MRRVLKLKSKKEHVDEKRELEDLHRGMNVAIDSIIAIFTNDIDRAENQLKYKYNQNCYYAMAYGGLKTALCFMTVDKGEIDATSRILSACVTACDRYRTGRSMSMTLISHHKSIASMSDPERHAELCYAEVTLYKAMVSVSQEDSLVSLVKAMMQMRRCHKTFLECERVVQRVTWASPQSRDNFLTGVKLGVGSFNIMMSLIPPKQLRMLQFIGFHADKHKGQRDLLAGFNIRGTVRTYTCGIILLMYHLYPGFLFSTGVGPEEDEKAKVVEEILPVFSSAFPEGSVVFFLKGKWKQLTGKIEESTINYTMCIQRQIQLPTAQHAPMWEKMFNACLMGNLEEGMKLAHQLFLASNWSKCMYCYFEAILLYTKGNLDKQESQHLITMMKQVPTLLRKIGGKVPVLEEFAINRSQRFFAQGNELVVPLVEIIYLFNGFQMVRTRKDLLANFQKSIEACKKKLDSFGGSSYKDDSAGVYNLMRGVVYRVMGKHSHAKHHFDAALHTKPRHDRYVAPFTHYEIGVLHLADRNLLPAKDSFQKALNAGKSPYVLENRLVFRAHSALEEVESLLADKRAERKSPTALSKANSI